MMQAPNIGEVVLHHTADAYSIGIEPFFTISWGHWPLVHLGPLAVDLTPTKHVIFLVIAATLVFLTMRIAGRQLPADVADDVIRLFNAESTVRFSGSTRIPAARGVDGEVAILPLDEAARRARGTPPILCHARATARRLGVLPFPSLDVLELFAFARPARFCLPNGTPRVRYVDTAARPDADRYITIWTAYAPGGVPGGIASVCRSSMTSFTLQEAVLRVPLAGGFVVRSLRKPPGFGSVFVTPSAYRSFMKPGKWPDKTVLILEFRASGTERSARSARLMMRRRRRHCARGERLKTSSDTASGSYTTR